MKNDKITDLIYATKGLIEALRDRPDLMDYEDELKELVEETEHCLDEVAAIHDAEATTNDD